jgi:hypothetical protein
LSIYTVNKIRLSHYLIADSTYHDKSFTSAGISSWKNETGSADVKPVSEETKKLWQIYGKHFNEIYICLTEHPINKRAHNCMGMLNRIQVLTETSSSQMSENTLGSG